MTPKWRRGEGQGYVPYNRRANTALMDEKAVKLVCAAAIASSGGGHLCLVLDELGRNLGKEHRREAVALFRRIGETYGITVIGALQDDMEPYAIDACGQYIKLRRSSDAMPYNEPPVIVGHDEHEPRRPGAGGADHPLPPRPGTRRARRIRLTGGAAPAGSNTPRTSDPAGQRAAMRSRAKRRWKATATTISAAGPSVTPMSSASRASRSARPPAPRSCERSRPRRDTAEYT